MRFRPFSAARIYTSYYTTTVKYLVPYDRVCHAYIKNKRQNRIAKIIFSKKKTVFVWNKF